MVVWKVQRFQRRAKLAYRQWRSHRIWLYIHDWGIEVL